MYSDFFIRRSTSACLIWSFALSYFRPLLECTISCTLQVVRKTTHVGRWVHLEFCAHVTAEHVVELFLFRGEFVREVERFILCFGKAGFDIKARTLQRRLLCDLVAVTRSSSR